MLPQHLPHLLAPSFISAPFLVPQSVPGAEDQGLGSGLKEPIIYEEVDRKIVLVYHAESWDGTGGPKEGWLT